jgi:hypothetical protein
MVGGFIIIHNIVVNLLHIYPHIILRTIATPPHKVLNAETTTTLALPLVQELLNIEAVLFSINRRRTGHVAGCGNSGCVCQGCKRLT